MDKTISIWLKEYVVLMKTANAALDCDVMEFEELMAEVKYVNAEYPKMKALEPVRSIEQITEDVKNAFDPHFMFFWFKMVRNTGGAIMLDPKKFKAVFDYYFELEDYEKCEVLTRSKKAHEHFLKTGEDIYDIPKDTL